MVAIVSQGALERLSDAAPSIPRAVRLSDDRSLTYQAIWKAQPQVRTVVSFLARNIAQLGLHTYERVSDTDRRRAPADHPMVRLIRRPNPYTTRYRWLLELVSDMAIYDNAVHVKMVTDDDVTGLARLPVHQVEPVGGHWLTAEGYKFTGGKGERVFAPEEVVHFRGYNALDSRWGASPLEALRSILAEEAAAAEYRTGLWGSGARISGVIERPKDAPPWSDIARERFRGQWQDMYSAGGEYYGGTAVLEDGMAFKEMGQSARDAQYVEARKLTREEVAAAYHIPPPMVGILDHATFSNITEQHKQLYQDTLGPWLVMIEEELELQLLPDLGNPDREYVEFNLAEKLKGSFEEQAKVLTTATGGPVMTRNEGRARLNLPRVDDPAADELITPLNVAVVGDADPSLEGEEEPP